MALTAEEQRELAQLEAQFGQAAAAAAPAKDALSADEAAELAQLEAAFGDQVPKQPSLTERALSVVGKTLDLPSGIGRTAIAGAIDPFVEEQLLNQGDVAAALRGEAVPGVELLKRAGITPESFKDQPLTPPNPFTPEQRMSATGMAVDIAADPTLAATKPLSTGATRAGEAMYKSGLKRIDQEAIKYGKEPVSDLLLREGIWGRARTIKEKMDKLAARLLEERNKILQRATEAGAKVSMKKAMEPIRKEISAIRQSEDPELQALAGYFEKKAKRYESLDPVAAYTELKRTPEQIITSELPTQARFEPSYTELKGYTTPTYEEVMLPQQATRVGPYRQMPKSKGGLPMGQIEPPGTEVATKFRQWRQMQETPEAILTGEAPYNLEEAVQMSQLIPEQFLPKSEAFGLSISPRKAIPGQTFPERYLPQTDIFQYYQPPGFEPGRRISREKYITPMQASGFKTTAGAQIPKKAWATDEILTKANRLKKVLRGGLQKETESSVGKALSEADELELMRKNADLGKLLTTKEKQAMDAVIEERKNYITPIDLAMGAYAAQRPIGKAMVVAKKLGDIGKTTAFRTGAGLGLRKIGQSRALDPVQVMLQRYGAQQLSPWTGMQNE